MATISGLSSWFKSEDIDGGLAADFDGSLSGLGVELGSNTYNMSEALLALPVFKQETIEPGFQYILNAATSPATKMNEETLTYLNQGQSYEIKLKKFGDILDDDIKNLRNIVRVVFHDRRLQYMEREQLDTWRQTRPGERILDIDVPLCHGITDIHRDAQRLNTVEFKWDPSKEAGVFIKVHCISTEFTAKKHGGEKGVPFRVQVETYLDSTKEDNTLIYCASCQVKVFKPKGADRKHKTDRERMEKRSEAEKLEYRPPWGKTFLMKIPVDQATQYLRNQEEEPPGNTRNFQGLFEGSYIPVPAANGNSSPESVTPTKVAPPVPKITPKPAKVSTDSNSQDDVNVQLIAAWSPWTDKNCLDQVEPLSLGATSQEVAQWLHTHRFSNYVRVFQNFSGADLLRLTRDDLIQICGLADGIRLNNGLQHKAVRPRLTIYVCQESAVSKQSPERTPSSDGTKRQDVLTSPKLKSPASTSSTSTVTSISPSCNGSEGQNKGTVSVPPNPPPLPTASKRQFVDADSPDDDTVVSSKKQRTRNLEMSRKTAYHALYLENLTVPALVEKVAQLYSVQAAQIMETFIVGPSGILVHVTDNVVANFADQSRFSVEALLDDNLAGKYRLLMKQITE